MILVDYLLLAAFYYVVIGVITYVVSWLLVIFFEDAEEIPSKAKCIFKWPVVLFNDMIFIIKNI